MVESPRLLGDLAETRRIHPRSDRLSALVAHEIVPAVLVADRDEGSGGGSESDREDPDAGGGGFLRRLDTARLKILAVGHEYQGAAHPLTFPEGGDRHSDRRGDIGSSLGDGVGVEILERSEHSSLVEGQRRL